MVEIINMTYIIANKLLFVGTPFGVWTGGFCVQKFSGCLSNN